MTLTSRSSVRALLGASALTLSLLAGPALAETVFTKPLVEMGATIQLYRECLGSLPCRFRQRNYKHSAVIFGPTPLTGRDIDVPDLRGGFSHLIAALAASGPSDVHGISLIDRGYADFRGKLEALGADFD